MFIPAPSSQKRPGPTTLPESFIGDAGHNMAHVAQLMRLGVIVEAPQVQFPFDALEGGGVPSQISDGQLIVCGEQPGTLKGDAIQMGVRKTVDAPVRSLEHQLAVEQNPVDPFSPGGQNAIPGRNLGEDLTKPGRRLDRPGRVTMRLKEGRQVSGGDHARLKIVDGADIGQIRKPDDRVDVEFSAAGIDLREIRLEMVKEVLRLLQGIAMLFAKQGFPIVAHLLLKDARVVEADARQIGIGNPTAIGLDFDTEQIPLGEEQNIALQEEARFAGMRDDRVGETHPLLIIQEALGIQFSQRAKARLFIEFDRRKGLKRSGDALDEGHRGPPCSCVLTRWAGIPSQERATVAQTSMKVCLSSCLKSIAGSKRFFQAQTLPACTSSGKTHASRDCNMLWKIVSSVSSRLCSRPTSAA